jgi:murein DD-endopeptidase MepM/ murein hydrolase activator NlpD
MSGSRFGVLYRIWFLTFVLLIATNLVLLSLQLSATNATGNRPTKSNPVMPFNLHVATENMSTFAKHFGQTMSTAGQAVMRNGKSAVRSLRHETNTVSNGMVGGLVSLIGLPAKITGSITNLPTLGEFVRPADKVAVPAITPVAAAQLAAHPVTPAVAKPSPLPAPPPAPPLANVAAQWPIHGTITTLFGAPDWPYESVHTGIDITDGNRSGTTPIKAFKPGQVVEVIHSYSGLGNHVTVSHGGGMTSIYGHMSATAVQQGQQVDQNTTLGYEGSTGASTGAHLHFEIRVNGQPVNPMNYISGRP